MTDTIERRRFVTLVCGTTAAGLAGCAEPGGDEETPAGGGGAAESPEPQEGPVVEPNNTGEQQPGMGPAEENETLEDGVDPDRREGAGTEAAGNESAGGEEGGGAAGGDAGDGAAGGENETAGSGNGTGAGG